MVTDLLYQRDAYMLKFAARVTAVEDGALVLDRTAFYPGGGGQEPDQGVIRWQGHEYPLTKLGKSREYILHWVKTDAAYPLPPVGMQVHGLLDWDRRLKLMRTHTALHILCGVIWRDYGAQVTGANVRPLRARMDFELEQMSAALAAEVEAKVNAEVAAARPVTVRTVPREQAFQIPDLIRTKTNLLPEGISQVRVVEIEDLDMQADGGTHVANTREVRDVRIVKHESKGRINKRLHIALNE